MRGTRERSMVCGKGTDDVAWLCYLCNFGKRRPVLPNPTSLCVHRVLLSAIVIFNVVLPKQLAQSVKGSATHHQERSDDKTPLPLVN
eukprot:1158599-Pelagomonas_calceolata.AAC.7